MGRGIVERIDLKAINIIIKEQKIMALFGTSRFKNLSGVSAKTYNENARPSAPPKPISTTVSNIDPLVNKTVKQEVAHLSAPTNIAPVSSPKPNSPIFGGGFFGGGMAERARIEAERKAKIAAEKAKEAQQTQTIVTTRTVPGPFGQPITVPVTQTVPAQKQVVTAAVAIRNEAIKEAIEAEKALQEAREAVNKTAKAAETIKKEIAQIDQRQDTLQTLLAAKPAIRTVPGIFGRSIQIPVPGGGASIPLAQRQALERELQELNEREKLALEAKKQIELKSLEIREDVKEAREEKVAADQAVRAANAELNKTIVQQQLKNIPRLFGPPPNLIKPISIATPDKSVGAAVKEEAVKAVLGDIKTSVSSITSKPPTAVAQTALGKLSEVVRQASVPKTPTFGGLFSGGSLRPTNMFESMMDRLEAQAKENAARAAAFERQNNAQRTLEVNQERFENAVEREVKTNLELSEAQTNVERLQAELNSIGRAEGIKGAIKRMSLIDDLNEAKQKLDQVEAQAKLADVQLENATKGLQKATAQVSQSQVKPVGSVKPLTNAFGFTIPSSILGRDKDDRKDDTKEINVGDVDNKPSVRTGLFGAVFRPPAPPVAAPEPQTASNALATLQRSGLFGKPVLSGATKGPTITEIKRTPPTPPKPFKGFGKF
jgi:hypothetical protein